VHGQGTAPERRWRNRPLVREPDHRRIFWLWTMLAAMVIAALPSGAYLFHQNRCLEVSYQVSALAAEHQRLLEQERRLRVERAALESLEPIERWARKHRGLVRPAAGDVVVVGSAPAEPVATAVRRASRSTSKTNRPRSGREVSSYR
jgi:cell division protein FtsL